MKYLVVIGDGMADYPVNELGGKSPLQIAYHPNMDALARKGVCGTVRTIPSGMDANTDVAILSIMGYDPRRYKIGRGALEAASMGVALSDHEVAFRINLVTEKEGILKDYAAGHISTEEARQLILILKEFLEEPNVKFCPGLSYRHLLILGKPYSDEVHCYPAHDVVGRRITEILAKPKNSDAKKTADLLNNLVLKSRAILTNHPINIERSKSGNFPANMIWPWGPGKKPNICTLREKYRLSSAVISAVDVVNGLGVYAGMDLVKVPGATGFIDTNYEGKADYALRALENHDLVLIHVEAPDEAGHIGDPYLKVKTIEDLDRRLLGRLLEKIQGEYAIAVLSDHFTPVSVRTHKDDPVPFVFYSTNNTCGGVHSFDEVSASSSSLKLEDGYRLLRLFLEYGCSKSDALFGR
ncbi:MAG: cofactor-independent phosphoglycerate mutase [Candidatus Bathyarchaeia archaeon]